MKTLYNALNDDKKLRRVTVYFDAKTTMKLTRQRPYAGRARTETFLLTIGAPNYPERMKIKTAKKEGKEFPRTEFSAWPKKRTPARKAAPTKGSKKGAKK